MKQELKNLTPEMVEELRTLGIEFGESICYWVKHESSSEYSLTSKEDVEMFINDHHYIIEVAPSLYELLDKLPAFIKVDGIVYTKTIRSLDGEEYMCQYLSLEPLKSLYQTANTNPLIAAYELLCYVAKKR